MLALAATIAGSIITGYSAYKIHAARKGEGRKLRDMEVLRRLNIPPKKQVRAWGFLMALGLVLLSPGLGFLLSYDHISSDGGIGAYSDLRATPSGSPVMAPPSEKLDKTPRAFDEDGSSGRTVFASSGSGGGGGGKKSSSGGGKTASTTSSTETAAAIDETSSVVYDENAGSSGSVGSTSDASDLKETPVIYKADPASDGPEIETDSVEAAMAELDEPEVASGETEPPTMPQSDGGKSDELAETAFVEVSDLPKIAAEAAAPEGSKEYVSVEVPAEDGAVPDENGVAEPVPEPARTETKTESATIDAAREKRTAPNASMKTAAESLNGPSSAEVQRETTVIETGFEDSVPQEGLGSSEIETEFEETSSISSSGPNSSDVEAELPAAYPPSEIDLAGGPGSAMVGGARSSISDPAEEMKTEIGEVETKTAIDEVKKLEFKLGNVSEAKVSVNVSVDDNRSANNSSSNRDNDSEPGPGLDVFGRRLDFDTEFENLASLSQPEMGIERNESSVTLMEFERIDLVSNHRKELGLTPTSSYL